MDIKPAPTQQQNQQNMYGQQPMQQTQPGPSAPQGMPQQSMNQNAVVPPHVKKAHGFIFGYIMLVVLALAVGGVYYWQHKMYVTAANTAKDVSIQLATEQAKTKALTAQVTTLNKKLVVVVTPPVTTSLKVTELGIQINNVPATLTGLTYTYTKATNSAVFSTPLLTLADAKCAASTGTGIGKLSSTTGTYSATTTKLPTSQTFVKQLTSSYLTSASTIANCSMTATVNVTQAAQVKLFETLVTTPANIVVAS